MKWLFDKLINGESFTLDYFINMEGDNFPLLYDLSATNQDTIWHEEGNVYIHTSMVLAEAFKLIENNEIKLSLNEKAVLVLSAVFHDIGKTSTTKTIDIEGKDRVISPRHPQVGASYLQYRLDLGNKELEKEVIDVVMHHHDVKKCILGNSFESEILYITRNVAGKLLYLLEVADIKGRICPEKDMLLFDLEIFKEYAERTNCFYEKGDLDKRLIEYFKESGINVDINSHSFIKTKYDLLNGIIDEPHTGLTKHYQNINPSIGYVLVGLSGSGKTTTASKIAKAEHVETIISTDSMRKGNKKEDRKEAYRLMLEKVKECLREKKSFIVDATNIRADSRDRIHELICQYDGLSCVVYIDTNINKCIENDKTRDIESQVGKDVICKQRDGFEIIKDKQYHMVY